MPQFAEANPTFVQEYEAARVVVEVRDPAKTSKLSSARHRNRRKQSGR